MILYNLLEKEIHLNKKNSSLATESIKQIFNKIVNNIIELNYERIALEFTLNNSIFFNILMNKIYKAHIEFYLTDANEGFNNAFYNLFQNKNSIISGYGKIVNIVKELNSNIK